jgi:photosystem II protein
LLFLQALGDRGRFIDETKPALAKAVIQPGKGFRAALGLKEDGPVFGFTKANELFVGRMAQLGFVVSAPRNALGTVYPCWTL